MKTTTNKGNLLAKVWAVLMVVMVLLTTFAPMKASAHSAYYLSTTLNVTNSRYEPIILFDRDGALKSHSTHREAKLGYFQAFDYQNKGSKGKLPAIALSNGAVDPKKVEEALEKLKGDNYVTGGLTDPHLIYTFPGGHNSGSHQATSQDLARAEWVSRTMVQSLNDAIGFIVMKAGKKPDKYELMYLGTSIANAGYYGGSVTFNGKKFTFKKENAPKNERRIGVNSDGYVKVTAPDKESRYFVEKVPKGYMKASKKGQKDQPLHNTIPPDLRKLYDKDVRSLTWKHVVLQAHYAYIEHETTYDNFEVISKPNKVEEMFTSFGENLTLGLRSMLGLYSFEQLMLNEGERGGNSFYLGIMPISWMHSAAILHWTAMALSWMLMFLALAKLLALRNLAAINIAKRVDLMDGIKSLIVVGFALMLFNPIFYALAHFNFLLVDVMKNTSNVTSQFGSAAPGAGTIARLLIGIVYLIVEIYFNFIYIARGIVVAILYGTGPLFIASLAFGGKYTQIFSNYMRELIGSIYTQTFHALLLAFFASVSVFGGLRLFEQLVVLFAFIPMTKFFRDAIGIGGGLMDVAGAGAFGAVGSLAQAGTRGVRSNKGKWASKAKSVSSMSKSSSAVAQTPGMKSASNFQSGGAGGSGGGSSNMGHVDNNVKPPGGGSGGGSGGSGGSGSSTATSPSGGATPSGTIPTKNATAGNKSGGSGSSMVDNDNGGDGMTFGTLAKEAGRTGVTAAFNAGAIAGAVGMAAVGNGKVSDNMRAVAKQPQRNQRSTGFQPRPQDPKPPKAPQNMGDYGTGDNYESYSVDEKSGHFVHSFKKQNDEGYDQLRDYHGVTNVEMEGSNISYTYDYNPETKSFNSGSFNTSADAQKMYDMYDAFNGETNPGREEAKAMYKSQGVTGVKYDAEKGMVVTASAGTGGIHNVSSNETHYRIAKGRSSNTNGNLLDAIKNGQEEDRRRGRN